MKEGRRMGKLRMLMLPRPVIQATCLIPSRDCNTGRFNLGGCSIRIDTKVDSTTLFCNKSSKIQR